MIAPRSAVRTIAIAGRPESLRRRLVARLVEAVSGLGHVAAVVKYADDAPFDRPHSDSDRLRRAGAVAVGLVARDEAGLYTSHSPTTGASWIVDALRWLPSPPRLVIHDGGAPERADIECTLTGELDAAAVTPDRESIVIVCGEVATEVPLASRQPVERAVRVIVQHVLQPASDA